MATPDPETGPINLGNPGEFSVRELAETIIEMTGTKSAITFMPLPQDDPKQRQPDIRLAQEKLGWAPQTNLRAGLERTIAYFDRVLSTT
jgi:UDP-glucuronate decarboxylase